MLLRSVQGGTLYRSRLSSDRPGSSAAVVIGQTSNLIVYFAREVIVLSQGQLILSESVRNQPKFTLTPSQQRNFERMIKIGALKQMHREKILSDGQLNILLSELYQEEYWEIK